MNTTEKNRALVAEIMAGLAEGDATAFARAMTDDFVWRTMAVEGAWSGAVRGRAAVRAYFDALYAQFDRRQTTIADRIIADGDCVVVEAHGGGVMTRRGAPYANRYCFVFTLQNGRLAEVREYMDTALADARLDPASMAALDPA